MCTLQSSTGSDDDDGDPQSDQDQSEEEEASSDSEEEANKHATTPAGKMSVQTPGGSRTAIDDPQKYLHVVLQKTGKAGTLKAFLFLQSMVDDESINTSKIVIFDT